MCASDPISYLLLVDLLKVVLGPVHVARLTAVSEMVMALLLAQSLHPADLARALPELRTSKARQAQRRVRRLFKRTVLRSEVLTPRLVRAVLWLVRDAEVTLVLDSTRCWRWEIFTLGIRFGGGRVVPVAWSVLPYPWPKKQFTPTVVKLLGRVFEVWPVDRPVHLVADRGFPSLPLFRLLDDWRGRRPLGYTIRVRASDWVRWDAGAAVQVGSLMTGLVLDTWQFRSASYQRRGKASAGSWLVVGQGQPVEPAHQRGPADQARRQARAERRLAHLRSKGQAQAASTDRVWALLTTKPTAAAAVAAYAGRFSTEGTYRDWKTWDLEAVARHETSATHLDGLLGLAAVGYLVQVALGAAAGRAREDAARARQDQWSTTDRLSVFWRGRQVLHDRVFEWRPWLQATLRDLVRQFRTQDQRSTSPKPTPIAQRSPRRLKEVA